MQFDIRAIGGHATKLTWNALRSFLGTLLIVVAFGLALSGMSYYFLSGTHWPYRVSASVLVLVESVALGVFISWKQAVVAAVAYAFTGLRLGGKLVAAVFDRMGVGDDVQGGVPGKIARGLESVPLAQAEAMLTAAVHKLTGDISQAGWMKRTVQAKLLGATKKYTLARFREENARHGSVELPKLRRELEGTIDDAVVRRVRGGLRIWTVVILLGLPLVAAVQVVVVKWLAPATVS